MTETSFPTLLEAAFAASLPPPYFIRAGDSPLIEGWPWTAMVVFQGRAEDHTITPGSTPHHWTVTAPNGMTYKVRDVQSLKFDNRVIDAGLTFSSQGEDGQSHVDLNSSAWGLALVHGLLGADAAADPALLGQVTAYVNAQGLTAVLERLNDDATLASLAGGTDSETLLTFAYKNFSGHGPSTEALTALQTEVSATLADWQDAATPANILRALLLGPSVANFFAKQPQTFSYDWFTDPLLGTAGADWFAAPLDGGVLDLGAGLDRVHFSSPNFAGLGQVHAQGDTVTVQDGEGTTWTLHHVERVMLGFDKWLAFDLEGNGAAGQAARLIGVSLGADAVTNQRLAAEVLSQIDQQGSRDLVQTLVDQGVFAQLAGGDSLEALIGLLYRNVTGTGPSASEQTWALNWAHDQNWDATDLILFAAELPQTATLIGLPELAEQGWGHGFGFMTLQ